MTRQVDLLYVVAEISIGHEAYSNQYHNDNQKHQLDIEVLHMGLVIYTLWKKIYRKTRKIMGSSRRSIVINLAHYLQS
jgi:hypothetical protein